MDSFKCIVCGNNLTVKHQLSSTVYECKHCNLLKSNATFDRSFTSNLDEEHRAIGLKQLRQKNFETIINKLLSHFNHSSKKIKGLEIGCGNGWWLEMCAKKNIDCTGIEPEQTFKNDYQKNNLKVIFDFYPTAVIASEKFDFIIFNDVFEHISDLDALCNAIKENLSEDGILIINIPLSTGLFYQTATFFNVFGMKSFLERMWQFNFHSPHIHYFNQKNLQQYLQKKGFNCTDHFKLETLDFNSINERIKSDKSNSKFIATAMTTIISVLKPLIMSIRPDIGAFFFQKRK